MKKIAVSFIILIIIVIYIGGFFNPTKIMINNLTIEAPENMMFHSLNFEDNYYILLLPFYQKTNYVLNKNNEIRFTLINKDFNKKELKSISFELANISYQRFNNRLKYIDKKEKLKKVNLYNKRCQIYSIKDGADYIYRVYHMDNNLSISVYSNIPIDNILKNLCS